ncbi:MAG TPA: methyltransferase domain-containing protein [Acidimicrobiales bacterium]|nr:methyltransferase domain-containing protein [Acidimicrobiales bacterium]
MPDPTATAEPDPAPVADEDGTAAPAAPALGNGTEPVGRGDLYGEYYYRHDCGIPYERSEHWNGFFGEVADHVVRELRPETVLDAGCAIGMLVEQLRNRYVDASGVDISEFAHEQMPPEVQKHCWVASLTEPLPRHFDLVTCIEVLEHMPSADGNAAIANLCAASERVLFSSSPHDYAEPTHLNVQAPEYWSSLFARHGFVRDFTYDASYLTPWAVLYVRTSASVADVVRDYDRAWLRQRDEINETRAKVLQMQDELAKATGEGRFRPEIERLATENEELRAAQMTLREELLRLRDLVVGGEQATGVARAHAAELSAQLTRYQSMEERLNDVLRSRSWRLMWLAGLPVRALRNRK